MSYLTRDSRKFLGLSAVAFALATDSAERLPDLREQAADRLYEAELAAGRDYGRLWHGDHALTAIRPLRQHRSRRALPRAIG